MTDEYTDQAFAIMDEMMGKAIDSDCNVALETAVARIAIDATWSEM